MLINTKNAPQNTQIKQTMNVPSFFAGASFGLGVLALQSKAPLKLVGFALAASSIGAGAEELPDLNDNPVELNHLAGDTLNANEEE